MSLLQYPDQIHKFSHSLSISIHHIEEMVLFLGQLRSLIFNIIPLLSVYTLNSTSLGAFELDNVAPHLHCNLAIKTILRVHFKFYRLNLVFFPMSNSKGRIFSNLQNFSQI